MFVFSTSDTILLALWWMDLQKSRLEEMPNMTVALTDAYEDQKGTE